MILGEDINRRMTMDIFVTQQTKQNSNRNDNRMRKQQQQQQQQHCNKQNKTKQNYGG